MNHNIKKNSPINQHYISKWFLSLFTNPKGKLHVYDIIHNSEEDMSTPSKEGCEKHFQTLTAEYENVDDPYILEKETGKQLEEPASKIVKTIIKTKKIPPINEFSYALSFVALIGCRNPLMKQQFIRTQDQIIKKLFSNILKDESTYNQIIDKMNLNNIKTNKMYDEMKKFHAEEKYTIEHSDEDEIINEMFYFTSDIVDLLLQKNWMLVETNTSNFYCSDLPLKAVTFHDNSQIDSIFFFPLSSEFALIGANSKLKPYKLISDDDVACINHFTALNASKIYSNQKITISNKTKSDLYPFLKGIIQDI